MILAFSLVFVAVFLMIFATSLRKRKDPSRKYFPGPVLLPYPIGCMIQFGIIKFKTSYKLHFERLHELNKKWGKTIAGYSGQLSAVITEDFEIAKEILTSPDFITRFPKHRRFTETTFNKNLGLLFSWGEPWKEIRKFTIKILKLYGFGELRSTELYLDEELEYVCDFMDSERKKSDSNEVFMHQHFKVGMFNTIWRAMSGVRFEYDDPAINRIIEACDQASKIEMGFDLEWTFFWLRYVPGFSNCWQVIKKSYEVQDYFKNIMIERRQSGVYKESQTNFIDYFLYTIDRKRGKPDSVFTDEQFIITCCDILYTGLDTTVNAVEFAFIYLVKYPRVQKKMQEEIEAVVGVERIPNWSDAKMMPYSRAVMLEVLRMANIVPLICRTSSCDTMVNGYFVQEDVLGTINLTMIHKDPSIWPNPEEFLPERFLDDDMNIINEDKLLVFGAGKRVCIGNTMAKVMWFKFVTTMLQKYTFEQSPAHPELSTIPDQGIANMAKPYYCIVKKRTEEEPDWIQVDE